jgi:CheY-like chemotaxis protein
VEGLEAARAFLPHVVVCDIGLPRLDGYGVARALRADPTLHGIYTIALTAFTSLVDQGEASSAGFDRHLAKPVSLWALRLALRCADDGASGADFV